MARNDVTISVGVDDRELRKSLSGLRDSIVGIGAAFAAAFAGAKVIQGIRAVTEAAATQEDAINQLNTSLKLAGEFSEEASQDFQDFASSLQDVTTVGDETTLQLAALARNFTNSNEQAKELTAAAIDLSAQTGISLESAITNLGKSLSGLSGELGESVKGIRELSPEALKSGEAIRLVADRFESAAAALRNTFSGAVQAAQGRFSDFLEELGFAITQNSAVIAVINELSGAFKRIGAFVKDNRDAIAEFVRQGIVVAVKAVSVFAKAVANNFGTALKAVQVFSKGAVIAFNFVQQGIDGLILAFTKLIQKTAEARGFISDLLGFDEAAAEARETARIYSELSDSIIDDIRKRSEEITDQITETADILNSPALSPKNNAFLETLELISKELDVVAQKAEKIDVVTTTPGQTDTSTAGAGVSQPGLFDSLFSSISASFSDAVLKGLAGIAVELKNVLVSGAQDFADKSAEEQSKIAKDSAGQFVASAAGAFAEAFVPGAGQFVSALLSLAQDPESFAAFINAFVEALPEVINGIVEGLPIIIQAFIDNLPALIDALIEGVPLIIEAFIDALPDLIAALIEAAPRIAFALVEALVELAPRLVSAIVQGIGEGIRELFKNLQEDLTGGGVQIGGTLGQATEGIKDLFGFQDGGVVPPGFPNDTFPARLTSGEVVLNEEQQAALNRPQMITVNLTLNEDVLASTILELNRDNRRLA